MDIYCPKCSEPYDVDELHYPDDETLNFNEAKALFMSKGCGEVFGNPDCVAHRTLRGDATLVLNEILGDDIDGVASMLDDFDYLGMLD